MSSSRHQEVRPIHGALANGVRNLLSRGASVRSARGNRRASHTASTRGPPQQTGINSMSNAASTHQTARPVADELIAGEAGGSLASADARNSFWRHQSQETLFRPPKVPFPPPSTVTVGAVWSWQMGDGLWIPFDLQVLQLLESLWLHLHDEQQQDELPGTLQASLERTQYPQQHQEQQQEQEQPQEGEQGQDIVQDQRGDDEQEAEYQTGETAPRALARYKLYVHLVPWNYCLDLHTVTQKNLSTNRVRPIRRTFETVGLWFARGPDGYAERFAPELEVHLESLWQESRDGRRSPGPLVIAWQNPRTDSVHYTDVRAMKDSTGNGSHRDIMRMELVCVPQHGSPTTVDCTTAEDSVPTLPSLEVGSEESGEAFCIGHKEWFDPDDFRAALNVVRADEMPEDACAICLETFVNGDCEDSERVEQEFQQNADANTQSRSVTRSVSSNVINNSNENISHSSSSGSRTSSGSGASSCSSSNVGAGSSSTEGLSTQRRSFSACTSEGCSEMVPCEVIDCEDNSPADDNSPSKSNLIYDSSSNHEVVKLCKCPHHFHSYCIRMYMKKCSRGGFFCPTCNVLQLPGNGPSPPGKMSWRISRHSLLAGHPTEGTIIIDYVVEGGIQTERHAHPNTPFTGTRRQAFLPDCLLGRQLLRLLIRAFVKGHTFTVGNSVTSGQSNVVIWNGIHHKTSVSGGLLCYGYPDDTFLLRLAEELRERGFPLEQSQEGAEQFERTRGLE